MSISAVPVLPATSMPWSAAAVPVPSLTTWLIIAPTWRGRLGRHHARRLLGLERVLTVRPSGSTILSPRRGSISTPPLATAAATIAICSGVTEQLVLADRHAPDVDRAVRRRARQLPVPRSPLAARSSRG